MIICEDINQIEVNNNYILEFSIEDKFVSFDYTNIFEQTDTYQWPYIKSEHLLKYIRNANRLILPFVSGFTKLNDKYKIDEN